MRPLLQFFLKHINFFLFLLMEFFAFFYIVKSNYYQQSVFINSANAITGGIFSIQSNLTDYLSLKIINKRLAEENARLRNNQRSAFLSTNNKTFVVDDTLYQQQYEYTEARVVANTTNKINNYITLNKGFNHGIRKEMGVITPLGVAGIVKDVSANFCTVTSVLHSKSKISAKIKKNNYIGTLVWEGGDYRLANLKDIPTHVKIASGDTIVTSGYSLIFPGGLMIGTVYFYDSNKDNDFYNIKIRLSTDFNKISYVYIVKSLMKPELEELKIKTQND
ncbi:MAG TPA: rod shape-determining protein MreC [Bacteroidales bacterium]|mgnify:FL=1|nr:rod shape-determining protein MreC [Bacteroidales bacterium]HPI30527.1 rod shape-determining protein MreC [Bacteroidales bacterium]HQN15384.1 rod shape-determining protein MreC [Bacteroidales bacterium]HQP14875.1 rod shape-determining protein MreC [Bacteroidales bacterium]